MTICLNRSVLDFMEAQIDRTSFVLEFGAGGSSRWFADRCGRLLSIEDSPAWAESVCEALSGSTCDWRMHLTYDPREALADVADVDLALVDGGDRNAYARLAWPLLRAGGWMVLDDAQRDQYAATVAWLNTHGEARRLEWTPGDVVSAKERLALAWRKL